MYLFAYLNFHFKDIYHFYEKNFVVINSQDKEFYEEQRKRCYKEIY